MAKLKPAVGNNDHHQGAASAPVQLVEYGDYQCPHCGRAHPIVKSILQKMGTSVQFVFRNFPLSRAHPNALHAAVAAEAAALQDRFWEMHDHLFEHQDQLDDASLMKYAADLKLNMNQFKTDFEKQELTDRVEADFESGVRSGVNGTPSFFINAEKYEGSWDETTFLAYLKTVAKSK